MHFFINAPGKGARKRKAKTSASRKKGGTVAKRRRRKVASNPKRRRRRNPVRHAAAPKRRRRTRINPAHRRRHRRYGSNPSIGGVVTTLKRGVMDGGIVFVGALANEKIGKMVDGVIPTFGDSKSAVVARAGVVNFGVATAITFAARKFAPRHAAMLSAGAFSRAFGNVLGGILAGTEAAKLLSDYDAPAGYAPLMNAYPDAALLPSPRMGAYAHMDAYPEDVRGGAGVIV